MVVNTVCFTTKELARIAETAGSSKAITTTVTTAIHSRLLLMNQYIPFHYTIILPIHQVKTGKKIAAHQSEPDRSFHDCLCISAAVMSLCPITPSSTSAVRSASPLLPFTA